MKKKKKDLIYVDCSTAPLLDARPPRDQRPKCLNCEKTVLLRATRWYGGSWNSDRPVKYYYDGETFFCCRNCSLSYAYKSAKKVLNMPDFNEIN